MRCIPYILFFALAAFCQWLAHDYSEKKDTFAVDCQAKGGHAITPRPGAGGWVCLKQEDIIE